VHNRDILRVMKVSKRCVLILLNVVVPVFFCYIEFCVLMCHASVLTTIMCFATFVINLL
jgi:hypothetical protein